MFSRSGRVRVMFLHKSASAEGVPSLPPRSRIWLIVGLTMAAAFALLVIVTIISGPMPPMQVATNSSTVATPEPLAPDRDAQGQAFGGSWTLAVRVRSRCCFPVRRPAGS